MRKIFVGTVFDPLLAIILPRVMIMIYGDGAGEDTRDGGGAGDYGE